MPQLAQNEVRALRSLRRTAIVLLVMMRLRRPVRIAEIAAILDIDRGTASSYLRSLTYDGLLTRTGAGYMLTSAGWSMLLGSAPALDDPQAPDGTLPQPAQSNEPAENGEFFPIPEENSEKCGEIPRIPTVVVKDIKTQDSGESTTTNPERGEFPPTRRILQETHQLFGNAVTCNRTIADRPPAHALGWVAQAYHSRSRLRFPPGLVYRRLMAGKVPERRFMERPGDFLPNEYMAALGLADPTPEAAAEAEPDPEPAAPAEADPSIRQPMGGGGKTPEQAWQAVLRQLQAEMPRAAFDTWVQGTRPLAFRDGVLTVGAADDRVREWLADRLTRTAERMLVGICAADVRVAFVVGEGR